MPPFLVPFTALPCDSDKKERPLTPKRETGTLVSILRASLSDLSPLMAARSSVYLLSRFMTAPMRALTSALATLSKLRLTTPAA